MEKIIEHWRGLSHEQLVLYSAVTGVFICRSYAFRYIRAFTIPLGITFVAVRAINPVHPNMVQVLLSMIRTNPNIVKYENIICDIVGLTILFFIVSFIAKLISLDFVKTKKDVIAWGFNQVRGLSVVKNELAKEQNKLEESFEKDLKVKSRAMGVCNYSLPKKGLKHEVILKMMKDATVVENVVWETGHVSGAVYNGQHKHIDFLNEAFAQYSIANALHPDIWPSVMKFDSEIVAMTASLVNGGNESVCGTTSSVSKKKKSNKHITFIFWNSALFFL